jgi:hypothetical protein
LADIVVVSGGADGVGLGIGSEDVGEASMVGDGAGKGEFTTGSGDAVAGGVVVLGDGAGGGVVVVDDDVREADGLGVGVGASAATCAAAAGGATGGPGRCAPSGTVDRPPLPFVPGGTGPGADGVGITPVKYARAHCSTAST